MKPDGALSLRSGDAPRAREVGLGAARRPARRVLGE